eukprot:TRINITY_DN7575_c0_g1_i2.p1 TRINITY_DN7575_c0_g1~~TRINITY_DN7575_c0_g1_i2.p1  ORF type:complete len:221 (+),score=13.93 TRINITY_DN7575_c0_g1_i2:117-779(+)
MRTNTSFLRLIIIFLGLGKGVIAQEKPSIADPTLTRNTIRRKSIIDFEDKVCTPRKECFSNRARISPRIQQTLAFTDSLNEIIQEDPIPLDDGLIDIPLDIDGTKLNATEGIRRLPLEDDNGFISSMQEECSKDRLDYCEGKSYKSSNHTMCRYCGLGKSCPYYLNPQKNDVTGRAIQDSGTINYILRLHNEIRSKIATGRCDQPKAGCMHPLKWDPELA